MGQTIEIFKVSKNWLYFPYLKIPTVEVKKKNDVPRQKPTYIV